MIVSRAPVRVSLIGGGTDYPEWFKTNGGSVIGVALDKYVYNTIALKRPYFDDYKYRLVYNKIEAAMRLCEIEHPAIREVLRYFKIDKLEVYNYGDVPSHSGLGTSSSFVVSLIRSLKMLEDVPVTRDSVAKLAIKLEREIMEEPGGWQDQIFASYGGWLRIRFGPGETYSVVQYHGSEFRDLEERMLVVFTGKSRLSFQVSADQKQNINEKRGYLGEILDLVDPMEEAVHKRDYKLIGSLLTESWNLKKQLSTMISTPFMESIIEIGMESGAYGAKVIGAGGGGSVLFIVEPYVKDCILANLPMGCYEVPVKSSEKGSVAWRL